MPFHLSASGAVTTTVPSLLSVEPTAVQAFADEQDTAVRVPLAPLKSGPVEAVQDLPFHRSMRMPEPLGKSSPTATQAVVERQETPFRTPTVVPAGSGVVIRVQLVPFHTSANGAHSELVVCTAPTATQNLTETHDTALSEAESGLCPEVAVLAPSVAVLAPAVPNVMPTKASAIATTIPRRLAELPARKFKPLRWLHMPSDSSRLLG